MFVVSGKKFRPKVIRAVINSESLLFARYPLETSGAGSGMHHRKTDVVPAKVWTNHELRSRSHKVVRATIAPKPVARAARSFGSNS